MLAFPFAINKSQKQNPEVIENYSLIIDLMNKLSECNAWLKAYYKFHEKAGLRQFLKSPAPIPPPSKGFKHILCESKGIQQHTQLPKNFQNGERK